MKIIIIAFSLSLLTPIVHSQLIQKYVVDGKTYYGAIPAGLSLDVQEEDVMLHNASGISNDNRQSSTGRTTSSKKKYIPTALPDNSMGYNERKNYERQQASKRHRQRMDNARRIK